VITLNEKGSAIIDPNILAIPVFNRIYNKDKTKDKNVVFKFFSYLYLMFNPESPYQKYPEEMRNKQILDELFKDKPVDLKDKDNLEAIAKYKELKIPEEYDSLEGARMAMHNITKYLKESEINDKNINAIQNAIKGIESQLTSFSILKSKVMEATLGRQNKKGTIKIGNREDEE
jgi:hypothetical protein